MTRKSPTLSLKSITSMISTATLASSLLFGAAGAASADPISGIELQGIVAGNTVEGQLADGGVYRVFYDPSGVARTDASLGSWRLEGNRLCAEFEENDRICLASKPSSSEVLWLSPHGDYEGDGRVLSGNPFRF